MRHQRLLLCLTQTLFHSFFDTCQTCAVLVLGQLAHATYAAIAQVIDVIDFAAAIAQINQDLDHGQDVFVGEHHWTGGLVAAHTGVELHTTHARQIIRIGVVEQALEQGLHCVFCRWLTRAHHAVDGHTCCEFVNGFVHTQCLRNVRTLVEFVGVDTLNFLHTRGAQFFEQGFCEFFVGLGNDFASVGVDNVACHHAANEEVFWHADVCGARLFEFTGVTNGNAFVFGDNHFARLVGDVEASHFAAQTLGHKFHLCATVHQAEIVVHKEVGQNRFWVQANGFEQNGDGHLATTVNTEVQQVFWVEFVVEPRTAVRNNARAEQQFARAVCLALVVLKEHAR